MGADRQNLTTRKARLGDPDPQWPALAPEQRLEMMWQLAVDAWAFRGEPVVEPRLPRHVVRVIRGPGSSMSRPPASRPAHVPPSQVPAGGLNHFKESPVSRRAAGRVVRSGSLLLHSPQPTATTSATSTSVDRRRGGSKFPEVTVLLHCTGARTTPRLRRHVKLGHGYFECVQGHTKAESAPQARFRASGYGGPVNAT